MACERMLCVSLKIGSNLVLILDAEAKVTVQLSCALTLHQ